MRQKTIRGRHSAFTMVEILVVLGILGVLAALLFPAMGRMREAGYQTTCISNLRQIGVAAQQYYRDEQRHPASLALLLPPSTQLVVATGPRLNNLHHGAGGTVRSPVPESTSQDPIMTAGTTGYIRDIDVIKCPDDDTEWNVPTSSYETTLLPVWNYYGYEAEGDSLTKTAASSSLAELLVNEHNAYNATSNPVRMSLSNRFAPPNTVVTHCLFHRMMTSDVDDPTLIYQNRDNNAVMGAKDVILRLDGSAKVRDVTSFATPEPRMTHGMGSDTTGPTKWQKQDF